MLKNEEQLMQKLAEEKAIQRLMIKFHLEYKDAKEFFMKNKEAMQYYVRK